MFPLEDAIVHAAACFPREACGVWVEQGGQLVFRACQPSRVADHFAISPREWLDAEKSGVMRGFFHVHPEHPPVPSPGDLVAIEAWGLPWVIMSWPSQEWAVFEPMGRRVDLLGRTFEHGSTDCFGLIRDYYRRLGVELPDVHRWNGWWKQGRSLYMEHLEEAGFSVVRGEPQLHDMILIQIDSMEPNHGAIYLGDNRILHHRDSSKGHALSTRAVYGDYWRKATTHIARHRDLC